METLKVDASADRTTQSSPVQRIHAAIGVITQGLDTLSAVIGRFDARELYAVRSLAVAFAVSNALLSLLYVGGLALSAFHPQKRAAHDLMVGSHVRFALKTNLESSS